MKLYNTASAVRKGLTKIATSNNSLPAMINPRPLPQRHRETVIGFNFLDAVDDGVGVDIDNAGLGQR